MPTLSKSKSSRPGREAVMAAVLGVLLVWAYYRPTLEMYNVWMLADSYYTHGPLVPLVSAYFLWRRREEIAAPPRSHSPLGYVVMAAAGTLLLLGAFLGFRVFAQLSLLPMLTGLALVLYGKERTRAAWFPIAYLIFMIPIPPSLTQSVSLKLKLMATQGAVWLAGSTGLPMIRKGSSVYWTGPAGMPDQILVGEVCGGLRSLIALLAFGAILAYISRTRPWAQWTLFACSVPVALAANGVRIFLLLVVAYWGGSALAGGVVHDISGIGIFVVAFALFFAIESLMRRMVPAKEGPA